MHPLYRSFTNLLTVTAVDNHRAIKGTPGGRGTSEDDQGQAAGGAGEGGT
jgi:hypothetical protein